MNDRIDSVAVLGAGTMGSGIAAASAEAGCKVLLLDVTKERATAAIDAMTKGRAPALSDPSLVDQITPGAFESDLDAVKDLSLIHI